jgi:hypothetical protein
LAETCCGVDTDPEHGVWTLGVDVDVEGDGVSGPTGIDTDLLWQGSSGAEVVTLCSGLVTDRCGTFTDEVGGCCMKLVAWGIGYVTGVVGLKGTGL